MRSHAQSLAGLPTLGYLFSGALMEEEAVHKSGAGHRRLGGHHPGVAMR